MKNTRKLFCGPLAPVALAAAVLALTGCVHVKVDPIHVTMDVNFKVDRELDAFFDDLDAKAATNSPPAVKPAEQGALP